jgi:hypothetical protein
LVALAFGACKKKDNTELVVTVWSDFAIPTEMDALRIRVAGKEQSLDHPFQMAATKQPGTYQIPVQLALVPAGADDLSITITAVGAYRGSDIVSQQAVLPFIPSQSHELVLYLARSCKDITCADHPGYTCDNGACTKPVAVDTAKLPVYVSGEIAPAPDAGISIAPDADISGSSFDLGGGRDVAIPDSPSLQPDVPVAGNAGSGGVGGAINSGGRVGAGGSDGTTASGGATGSGDVTGAGGMTSTTIGPCDIYAAANTPCVAAHSVVRALYGAYNGKIYQVRRVSDNTTKDIGTLAAGSIADTASEDTFCAGSPCVLTVVYDQSGKGNDLWYQGSDQVPASTSSTPANAITDAVSVGGHKVYSVYISPGNCYWHDGSKSGVATGSQPEGMYMVTSSRHANAGCCFDYGNSQTDRSADGAGTTDAINFSTTTAWGTGAGSGPWVMADLEYGLFAEGDNKKNSSDPTQTAPFVTAVLKNNGTTEYALRGGDATAGSLSTYYKGVLPEGGNPMKKQGALILGCGGDCCKPSGGANASSGIFFEGAIVTGYPTDVAEDAIQANIVEQGYGK